MSEKFWIMTTVLFFFIGAPAAFAGFLAWLEYKSNKRE